MISGPVVVDASVVVEYLVEMKLTPQATRLFRGLIDPDSDLQLWAPDLIYAEVGSALRKLVRLRAISSAAAKTAVAQVVRLPISATGTAGLLQDAWNHRHNITIYDACYLVLANRLHAPLVTADEKLVRALKSPHSRVVSIAAVFTK